ncbi:hypothetical protein RI129_000313 [Pyrocoelia pectoralis]|uniref:Chitin-binding type-2 domain-containing protein n=1 Tax=Pyrocoelia pectoralis TaxID=417401 RepID=A0AAN7VR82_9COLE
MTKYNYKLGLVVIFLVAFSLKKSSVTGLKEDSPVLHKTDYRERRDAGDYQKVDGTPSVEFPTYSHIPKTKFSCHDLEAGYYADLETDCQVFHICDEGRKLSFLCPNGTVFQQGELICDWWYKVNCTSAPSLYEESAEILQRENARRKSNRRSNYGTKQGVFSSRENYDTSGENPKDQLSITTEPFPQKYTSRSDRKFDAVRYEVSRNSIEPFKFYYDPTTVKYSQRFTQPYKFVKVDNRVQDINKNSLQELGIVIGPNNDLPLKTTAPDSSGKLRVSSYGNLLNNHHSGEAQEVQETASFIMNSRNRIPTNGKTYANHRESYSEVKDPRQYYQPSFSKLPNKPFYGSSVSPHVLSTVPISSTLIHFHPPTTETNRVNVEGRFSYSFKADLPLRKEIVTTTTKAPTTTFKPLSVSLNSNTEPNILSLHHDESNANNVKDSDITRININLPTLTTQDPNDVQTPTEKTVILETLTTPKIQTTSSISQSTDLISTSTTPHEVETRGSAIFQPMPFSVNPPSSQSTSVRPPIPQKNPFIIEVAPDAPQPTQPTPFTPSPTLSQIEENVNNMIGSLMNMLHQSNKANPNESRTSRPGLMIPPSSGPQTLHSLAIYFANALDNITSNTTEPSSTTLRTPTEDLLKDLLTQMTRNNYDNLFGRNVMETTTPIADDSENLVKDDRLNLIENVPNVRVLARVFTEALSAYLEDPETFKKVLLEVRPTEPSLIHNEITETDDDEVLNYSDSDLKPDHPYLHTTENPVSATWSYILALNTTKYASQNSLTETENLQSADSQSFISQLNKVSHHKSKGILEPNTLSIPLPTNHWTSSKDVENLWQKTLSINPADLNHNFDSFNVDSGDASIGSEEISNESNGSEVHYDLRTLPQIQLNSTQVHGILIDFMHSNHSQGSEKLQRILHKLNISENEFLKKMKEVEGNPFTRRLILLLINECNSSSEKVEGRAGDEIDTTEESDGDAVTASTEPNIVKRVTQSPPNEEEEDTRALQLLNSLYVIASKFGK